MDISLTKLHYLLAVAKTENFSRAAEELNLSQPALSRTVAAIEAHYGVTFFERSHSGARLTATGAQMIKEIETLLRNADNLDHNLHLYGRGEAGRVSVGFGPHIASIFLARLGRQIMGAKPGIKLRTLIRSTDILIQRLMDNQIDLFIAPDYRSEIFPEIEFRKIGVVSTALVVRVGHPLSGRKSVTFEEVAQWPFATPSGTKWPGDPGLFICDSYFIMRDIVLESNLVWLCAQEFVRDDVEQGRLEVLPVIDPPLMLNETPIIIAKLKGRTYSPIEHEITEFFEEAFNLAG
jgi:DNA-binding transcriptional LysR family regulator